MGGSIPQDRSGDEQLIYPASVYEDLFVLGVMAYRLVRDEYPSSTDEGDLKRVFLAGVKRVFVAWGTAHTERSTWEVGAALGTGTPSEGFPATAHGTNLYDKQSGPGRAGSAGALWGTAALTLASLGVVQPTAMGRGTS
jgi:hypothetical protein